MYPVQLDLLFAPFMPTATGGSIVKVHRELRHIDLTLEYENGETLIIENKVTSLPYLAQLERYTANQQNTRFLLLSVTEPYFLDIAKRTITLEDGTDWYFLNYKELGDKLQNLQSTITNSNSLHGQLLADYIIFIEGLDRVQSLFHFEPHDDSSNFFGEQEEIERLNNLRLADFIYKLRYAKLAQYVAEQLEQPDCTVLRSNWWEGKAGQFCVTSGMTHGVGLFDLKYIITEQNTKTTLAMVGIQLQGNAFRLVFEYNNKEKAIKIAEGLLYPALDAARNWFDFSSIPKPSQEYPKRRNFNQYSGTFIYRSKNLNATSPLKLIELILEYAKLMQTKQLVIADEVAKAIA